jgi:DNA-binding PadR family transcriptional regulator
MISSHNLLVLGFVSRRPIHGHKIKQLVGGTQAERWAKISQPHIYYVLQKLARSGYVTSEEVRVGNTPPRIMYSITEAGREALGEMLRSEELLSEEYYSDFDVLLAMLSFSQVLPAEECVKIVQQRLRYLSARIDELDIPEEFERIQEKYGPVAQAIYAHRIAVLRAEEEWLRAVLKEIEDKGWDYFTRVSTSDTPGRQRIAADGVPTYAAE